jgi:flagellar motor protein MotB
MAGVQKNPAFSAGFSAKEADSMIRRRREDAENPAWPGLVDIFGFTLAFILLLWFAANWPEQVENLERKTQDLGATIASMDADNRQLTEINQSLTEKLRLQGLINQDLTGKIKQLEESNENLTAQTRLSQANNLELNEKVQRLNQEKAALKDIGLKDWEELLKLLRAKLAKSNMVIIPNKTLKEIEIQGKPRVTFETMQYELSPNDKHRLEVLAPILYQLRQKKKFFITINGTADPRELQNEAPPRNNTELSALRAATVAAMLEKAAPGLGQYLRVTGLGVKGHKRTLAPGEDPDLIYRQYRSVSLVLKIDVAAIMQETSPNPSP